MNSRSSSITEVLVQESNYGLDTEWFVWNLRDDELATTSDNRPSNYNRTRWEPNEVQISRPFKTRRGNYFVMALFPNGIRADSRGHISIYLRHIKASDAAEEESSGENSAQDVRTSSEPAVSGTGDNSAGSYSPPSWVYATFQFFMSSPSYNGTIQSASLVKPNKFELETGQYSWGYPKFCKTNDFFQTLNFWRHEKIEIKCVLEQYVNKDDVIESPSKKMTPSVNELQQDMAELLKSGRQADLQVTINGHMYNLHRCVLTCRCPRLLLKKEQSKRRILSFKDVCTGDIRIALHYIYANELPRLKSASDCLAMVLLGKELQLQGRFC